MAGTTAHSMWSAEIGTRTLYRKAARTEPAPPPPRRSAGTTGYAYSPTRLCQPQVGAVLLELYREAMGRLGDPVLAWADVAGDPDRGDRYKAARGRGGLEHVTWEEAAEIFAAAHVHVIGRWGPDRIAGVSGSSAGATSSHAAGSRFISLIGGAVLTADRPAPGEISDPASTPAGAGVDAGYVLMWGYDAPIARGRGGSRKVVAVSPEPLAGGQADEWLAPAPGTDAALAMAMGHVVLKECFVNSPVGHFTSYAKRFTDLPYLITLDAGPGGGRWLPGKFVTAADLPTHDMLVNAAFKPMVIDARTATPAVPDGALGHRFGAGEEGRWSLADTCIDPLLSLVRCADFTVDVVLPRFDEPGATLTRQVPARRLGTRLVTTVYDLLLAQYAVAEGPNRYGDPDTPYTPAWQESITGVPAHAAARIAREFARNAARTRGRSLIVTGEWDWFHGDTVDRALVALAMLTGCQGVESGGRVRPGDGRGRPDPAWAQLAFGLDWGREPRTMAQSTQQLRGHAAREAGPAADLLALATRLGWLPSYPTFDRNPLDLADDAAVAGVEPAAYAMDELLAGRLRFACDDPAAESNRPRVLTAWGADLSEIEGIDAFAPEADLLCTLGPRAAGSPVLADLVLPTATPCELHDGGARRVGSSGSLGSVASFASFDRTSPGGAKTEWGAFAVLAAAFSRLAARHLGVRRDLVATPLRRDTADVMVTPRGVVRDWREGECAPVPGRTLPRLTVVERDYAAVSDRFGALGPFACQPALDAATPSPTRLDAGRLEPWPTLTGRQHFYLDHDWLLELGEQLPTYKPPLDLGAAGTDPGGRELPVAVRYLTARDEWSIQADFETTAAGGLGDRVALSPVWPLTPGTGPAAWIAEPDATRLGIADEDWVEVGSPRGRILARALVSPRLREGTVYLQRSQARSDTGPVRPAQSPPSRTAPILLKPSHLIGGYAHLAFGSDDPGPRSYRADETNVLRKHR